jgi:hypothetical protein
MLESGNMIDLSDVNDAVLGEFGEPIRYLRAAGGTAQLNAVPMFDQSFNDTFRGATSGIFVRLADLPTGPERGDKV